MKFLQNNIRLIFLIVTITFHFQSSYAYNVTYRYGLALSQSAMIHYSRIIVHGYVYLGWLILPDNVPPTINFPQPIELQPEHTVILPDITVDQEGPIGGYTGTQYIGLALEFIPRAGTMARTGNEIFYIANQDTIRNNIFNAFVLHTGRFNLAFPNPWDQVRVIAHGTQDEGVNVPVVPIVKYPLNPPPPGPGGPGGPAGPGGPIIYTFPPNC